MALQSERYCKDIVKFHCDELHRSALVDFKTLSVSLFRGNNLVIATNKMNQSIVSIVTLCKRWVNEGLYQEADFAA